MVSFRESRLSSQLETFTLSSRLDSGSSGFLNDGSPGPLLTPLRKKAEAIPVTLVLSMRDKQPH
jgi:hypothetical protein